MKLITSLILLIALFSAVANAQFDNRDFPEDQINMFGEGSVLLPSGNTAARPSAPIAGMFRWNTTLTQAEIYDGSSWGAVAGGSSSPTTTLGDLILRGASVDERLAIGGAGTVLTSNGTTASWGSVAGTGDVVGPGSATDNAISRFDTTTGKLIQNSGVTIDDSDNIITSANVDGRDVSADGTAQDTHLGLTNEHLDWTSSSVGTIHATNYVDNDTVYTHPNHSGEVTSIGDGAQTVDPTAISNKTSDVLLVGTEEVLMLDSGTLKRTTLQTIADLASGAGDVVGPGSATDNAISRYDSTTGKIIQNSGVIIDDSDAITGIAKLTVTSTTEGSVPCPAMTTAQIAAISGEAAGDCAYDSDLDFHYYYNGSNWVQIGGGGGVPLMAKGSIYTSDGTDNGELLVGTDTFVLSANSAAADGSGLEWVAAGSGSGDVVGPASATDNALARYDLTTGKLIQNSTAILTDAGALSGLTDITLSGNVDGRDIDADGTTLDNHVALTDEHIDWTAASDDFLTTGTLNTHTIPGGTGTLALITDTVAGANTVIFEARVDEAAGVSLGDIVYINGATGNIMEASLAINNDFSKIDAIAVATEAGADNDLIDFINFGELGGLDTSSFSEGDILYLDSTSGQITATHPTGIEGVMRIAIVVRQHASQGIVFVNIVPQTIANNHNGTVRFQLVNENAGTSSATSYTVVNDAGHRASITLTGENFTGALESFGLYNEGYGLSTYFLDGNSDHVWYTDVTDSHNFSATEKMRLTAAGNLTITGTVDGRDIDADGTAQDTHLGLTNEHLDWTDSSVGTIHATNYVDNDTVYTHPNHSGEVTSTGDGAQVLANTAISNRSTVTVADGDFVLIGDTSDSGNLKKVLASDFGSGDVVGPGSSTDNAVSRFDSTTGKIIQNSSVIIDDSDNVSGIVNLTATGTTTLAVALTGVMKAASGVVSVSDVNLTSEVTGTLPVANGGTNSSTALSNSFVMESVAGAIVESTTTSTELGFLDATSSIQTQIDTKAAGAASSTDNAVSRFDSTTGKIIQNSGVIIDDSDNITGVNDLTVENELSGDPASGGNLTILSTSHATKGIIQFGTSGGDEGLQFSEVNQSFSIGDYHGITTGIFPFSSAFQVHSEGTEDVNQIMFHRVGDVAGLGSNIIQTRARGTEASPTIIQDNDVVGANRASAYDGSVYQIVAALSFEIDGTPGVGDMPGRIIFLTAPDGSAVAAERMAIYQDGEIDMKTGLVSIGGQIVVTSTTRGSIPCPVMTTTQRDNIGTPIEGECIYNTTTSAPNWYDGTTWNAH